LLGLFFADAIPLHYSCQGVAQVLEWKSKENPGYVFSSQSRKVLIEYMYADRLSTDF